MGEAAQAAAGGVRAEELPIDKAFPGWRAWQSDTGRWWATRKGPAAQWGDEASIPMTVDADSETQLRQILEEYRDAA